MIYEQTQPERRSGERRVRHGHTWMGRKDRNAKDPGRSGNDRRGPVLRSLGTEGDAGPVAVEGGVSASAGSLVERLAARWAQFAGHLWEDDETRQECVKEARFFLLAIADLGDEICTRSPYTYTPTFLALLRSEAARHD